jgi:superfamily II DNA or RNA helicase
MKLYPYQEKALENMPQKAIFHWALGTGKTIASLAHYQKHASHLPLLVIAPASKVRTGDWEREAREFFGHDIDMTVISYEKISRMGKKYPNWFEFSPQHGGKRYAVIADEVHKIKSPSSKANRAIIEITSGGTFFAGLTGTALPNGWFDFAGYSKLFGFTKGVTEFKNKYCNIQTYKGWPEIVGYRNTDELENQWNKISRYLSRAQASELPDRQFITVNINDVPKEYYRLKLERTTKYGEFIDNPSKLAHEMRQATTEARMNHLDSILGDTTDNVVVFYNYISERKAILELLKKNYKDKTVYRMDGEKHEAPSKGDWEAVQNSVTLAHYKSASTGVELQYANVTVYFSPTYSYADYAQSIGRTHRNGQEKKCVFYCFNVKGTIDYAVWQCLKGKKDFQADLYIKALDNNEDVE